MKTIYTIKEQEEYLSTNWQNENIKHKWSSRGDGSSEILDNNDNVIGKASGYGYACFGSALGEVVAELFPEAVHKLAKRECKGKRRSYTHYKGVPNYYGLFYDEVKDKVWIDGAHGESCVKKILNKIGFSLKYNGDDSKTNNGVVLYKLIPLTKNERNYH